MSDPELYPSGNAPFSDLTQPTPTRAVVRACKHCKWCEIRPTPICFHPKSFVEQHNFYQGTVQLKPQSDQSMRTIGQCGFTATLFEPKIT